MGAKIQFKPSKESILAQADNDDIVRPNVSIDVDDIVAVGSKINKFTWEFPDGGDEYVFYTPEKVILFLDGLEYSSVYGAGVGAFGPANRFMCGFGVYDSLDRRAADAIKSGGEPLPTNFGKFQKEFNIVDATVKAIESLPGNQGVTVVEVGVDAGEQYGIDSSHAPGNFGPTPSQANEPEGAK
tara:strand:- start:1172 stop:1723 length:552 start_codon:yes stop_codon:yes gene_type:complete